ncbi:HNH endonuclease [Lysobacter sp. TY2-98]|uniref:HNH endonuclease n=1 Tax=Lysobacter sp. TY2-98 TaxID=2290922 RepID=UPI000E2064F9|nr:HNH endonuclease [Lysobacter sp. TY2-98]AXK72501.1 HNH endonuclease [Lysobacter sp. TY2-98]
MRPALRRLFLLALATYREAQLDGEVWSTRCLHCRTRLQVAVDGAALGASSLEHVVPQAWFGKRAAAGLTARVGNAPDDARNLAVACVRCNQDKGKGPDARGPADARAHDVVASLLDTRLARWRAPCGDE